VPIVLEVHPGRSVPLGLPLVEQLFLLSRPANALLPLLLLTAGFYAALGGFEQPSLDFYNLCISAFLLHAAFTVFNDVADRTIDADNNVRTIITLGTKTQRLRIAWGAAVLLVAAILIVATLPPAVTIVVLCMTVVAFGYNQRPLQFSRRPLASIISLGLLYGFLPFFAGYFVVSPQVPYEWVAFASLWMVGRISLSLLKDFKDEDGDARHGKQTFLLRYGHGATLHLSTWLCAISYVGITAILVLQARTLLLMVVVVVAALVVGVAYSLLRQRTMMAELATWRSVDAVVKQQIIIDGMFIVWLMLL